MIPYVHIPALHLFGDYAIQPFGVLVVAAVTMGVWVIRKRNQQAGLDDDEIVTALYWCLGWAFFISHVVEIVFYQTHRLSTEGIIVLFKVWDGISSMGGFFGALFGLSIYYRFVNRKPWLTQAEFIVQGLVAGWVFGRLGCTVVHDHPGAFTDFFLGVRYPEGTRHDLGFYEFLLTLFVLNPAMLLLYRFKAPPGSYIATACLIYAPARFLMDFARVHDQQGADPRYFGLTAGHFGSIIILGIGLYYLTVALRNRGKPATAAVASTETAPKRGKGKNKRAS